MSKTLSIIIPINNVEFYVGQLLESIFHSGISPDDMEVIVVNDGTRDNSMDVVRQFAHHPNLIIIEQENKGLSAARMKGLTHAGGAYVWFIDSDDWLAEDGVNKVLNLLNTHEKADVLMFPLRWVYEDDSKDHLDFIIDRDEMVSGKEVLAEMKLPVWAAPRYVIKRRLFENQWLRFPLNLLHEDEYFGAVLMSLTARVSVLSYPVYYYRQRQGSIMNRLTIRSAYDMVSIYKEMIRFMAFELDEIDHKWFRAHCFCRLKSVYDRVERYGSEFHRFALKNGLYIWKEWLKIHPEAKVQKRIGRLFFFLLPGLRNAIIR